MQFGWLNLNPPLHAVQCSAVPGFPSQEYIISSATAEYHNGRLSVTNYFRNHKLTDGGPYTSCSGFRCRFFSCPVAPDDGRDTSSVAWSKPRPALKTLPHFVNRVHARPRVLGSDVLSRRALTVLGTRRAAGQAATRPSGLSHQHGRQKKGRTVELLACPCG